MSTTYGRREVCVVKYCTKAAPAVLSSNKRRLSKSSGAVGGWVKQRVKIAENELEESKPDKVRAWWRGRWACAM